MNDLNTTEVKTEAKLTDILFNCGHCNRKLKTQSDEIGVKFDCPQCNGLVVVPAESTRSPTKSKYDDSEPLPEGAVPLSASFGGANISGATTKEASGNIISALVGGFLVIVTIVVYTILGRKAPAESA